MDTFFILTGTTLFMCLSFLPVYLLSEEKYKPGCISFFVLLLISFHLSFTIYDKTGGFFYKTFGFFPGYEHHLKVETEHELYNKNQELKQKQTEEYERVRQEKTSKNGINYHVLNSYYDGNNLVVSLRIKNGSHEPLEISCLKTSLVDNSGSIYSGSISIFEMRKIINPNMYRDISVYFAVPSIQDYRIVMKDSLFDDKVGINLFPR